LRSKLVSALEASGIDVKQDHGFIPHMTRAYLPAGSRVDAPGQPVPIDIDTVSVWAVGGRLRVPIRLSGTAGEVGDMLELPESVFDNNELEQPVETDDQADDQETQPEPNPVSDEEEDKALDSDIDELESQINSLAYTLVAHNMAVHELRTYQRARNGQFGSGGGIGSAAHGHSTVAKEAKSVGAHRTAARAHVAVARRLSAKGDKEKAAAHLAIAKEHRDDANKLKVEAKTKGKETPKETSKAEPTKAPEHKVEHKPEHAKSEHKEAAKPEHKETKEPEKHEIKVSTVRAKEAVVGKKLLGEGASRKVYDDGDTVIKVARSDKASREANKIEAALSDKSPLFAKIIEKGPNGEWIRQEKLAEIKGKIEDGPKYADGTFKESRASRESRMRDSAAAVLVQHFGINHVEAHTKYDVVTEGFLGKKEVVQNNLLTAMVHEAEHPGTVKNLPKNSEQFIKLLRQIKKDTPLVLGDFAYPNQWGLDKAGKPKIADYSFTYNQQEWQMYGKWKPMSLNYPGTDGAKEPTNRLGRTISRSVSACTKNAPRLIPSPNAIVDDKAGAQSSEVEEN
jgi:hypothetical protein